MDSEINVGDKVYIVPRPTRKKSGFPENMPIFSGIVEKILVHEGETKYRVRYRYTVPGQIGKYSPKVREDTVGETSGWYSWHQLGHTEAEWCQKNGGLLKE